MFARKNGKSLNPKRLCRSSGSGQEQCNLHTVWHLPGKFRDSPFGPAPPLSLQRGRSFAKTANLSIILLTPCEQTGNFREIEEHDAFSEKVVRPKLASANRHARACHLWCSGDLQRDFLARRFLRGRFLAKAGKLGRGRRFRVHDYESD